MQGKLFSFLASGAKQVVHQPRILFVLVLVVVFPLLLLAIFQQFLSVAEQNYSTAARLRTGTIHDSLRLLTMAEHDLSQNRTFLEEIMSANPDLEDIVIAAETNEGIVIIASSDKEAEKEVVTDTTTFTRALAASGEPLAFEFHAGGRRFWDTTSSFVKDGQRWFVVTRQSFAGFDNVMATREYYAYAVLMAVMVFFFGLGFWLVRDLDYRTKYLALQSRLTEQAQITNMIAHELRSPLTAMQGYASMIEEKTPKGEKVNEHAIRIIESTKRLVRLVNDFLEVARLQSGKMEIQPTTVLLAKLVNNVVDELRPMAADKDLDLQAETDGLSELKFITDEARLHQVLVNILSNAIKYTRQGHVIVGLSANSKQVEIRVKDTGSGISAEDQKRLFAPFFRVNNSFTTNINGTGLGMWITKQLVESLGGQIGVESIKDVGTNVVLRFKLD